MRILFLLVFFSFPAWSARGPVGSVDSDYGRESAACSNSPDSVSKASALDVRIGFHLANLQGVVLQKDQEKVPKSTTKSRRRGGTGGSKGEK